MITDATKPRLTQTNRLAAREQRIQARERFARTRRAERGFSRHLQRVARHVGHLVEGMSTKGTVNAAELQTALDKYAELLKPFAQKLSAQLIAEVNQRDGQAWTELARSMGQELKAEVRAAPVMAAMQRLQEEQVELITSLPKKAAQRIHHLTQQSLYGGSVRAEDLAEEIARTGEVTLGRAKLIARTETSRTASAMVEARSRYVGSTGYFWRTSGDSDVREQHRKLNGKFFRWDAPPVSGSSGERSHPGAIYNCRCYPEPVLPDRI